MYCCRFTLSSSLSVLCALILLFQYPQPIAQHHYFMKEYINRNFFPFLRFIGRLQQHNTVLPSIAQWNNFWKPPHMRNIFNSDRSTSLCFYFFGNVFRNDLFQMRIVFINLLYAMINKEMRYVAYLIPTITPGPCCRCCKAVPMPRLS